MSSQYQNAQRTRALLLQHFQAYPALQAEDIFKYLFHSTFGCDHLVTDEGMVLRYLQHEYNTVSSTAPDLVEPLDGAYCRVHLGILKNGLRLQTLARLFCLSAQKEPDGMARLEQKLAVACEMVQSGELPLDENTFVQKLEAWRSAGLPAIHHSATFRETYRPAYRVIAKKYADILSVLTEIDKLLTRGNATVVLEGGSASGKTTLADTLQRIWGSDTCRVFHTDDYFLRPEQRTPARLAEFGGNMDRERFYDEIVRPLSLSLPICYRRFDCMTQTLGEPVTAQECALTVVEGAYSLHPYLGKYYDLAVFLEVDPVCQKNRIQKRNSAQFAKRFFNEWIPLENTYFLKADVRRRADIVLQVHD